MKKKASKNMVKKPADKKKVSPVKIPATLLNDIRQLIEEAKGRVIQTVNYEMTLLYWNIGNRIRKDILKEKRAEYGEQIIVTLSRQLTQEYSRGFTRRNLFNMIRFAEVFPDIEIVQTLSAQLSWSHILEIIPLEDHLKKEFYTEMCRVERWSVRTLRNKIKGMLYERTAIAKKPKELIKKELEALREEDKMSMDMVFRDPYVLDFLELSDTYSERDLESAIISEIQRFITELGVDFAFVARQKRITIDHEDYYIDLLFYNRRLKRLLAIDLKLGRFKAAYKGQMELYLRWLEKYDMQEGEKPPMGLVLCAEKSAEHIELLQLEKTGIRVAEYLTELPPPDVLKKKLHDAIKYARERLELKSKEEPKNRKLLINSNRKKKN